jgi:hypothetical protein
LDFDLMQDFPVGLDRLWAALGRADYIEQKYRSLGSTSLQLRKFVSDARSIEVELDREAPVAAAELPWWARVLSGSTQAMRQHTRWTRVGRDRVDAVLHIRALGRGVVATGAGSVREMSPTHSRLTLHFDVRTTSPAVPAGVAEVFARQVAHALEADHAFTVDYLRAGSPRTQDV